ncbi:Hint domain-containing protein, partial [Streptomyces roseolus]
AVKHVAKKVVKAAKKVGRAVKKAAKATANFVKQHASTIASVATGIAVFAGCTAITAGVGAVGCAALAGAAANGVGYMMSDGPKSVGGFLGAVAIGAVTGAAGGVGGRLAASAAGKLLSGTAGKIATNAAEEAGSEALTGAVEYGTSCVNSEEGCSVAGAAKAATIGAVMGGAFGAKGKGKGRKGCTPHSFTAKTGVVMADGTVKPISEVKAGDYVLTAEPGRKTKEKHRVKAVIVTKSDRDYVDVVVATKAGPKTIETTRHHQFYEMSLNAWTQAADLEAGRLLQTGSGAPTEILEVRQYVAERVTYDLSVDGLHTYHVVAGAGSSVLVHNMDDVSGDVCPLPGLSDDDIKKGLMTLAKQRMKEIKREVDDPSHPRTFFPGAFSVGRDRTTGKIYYGESGPDSGLRDEVVKVLPNPSRMHNGRPAGMCGEPRMCTNALNDGADPKNLDIVTGNQKGKKFPMCKNCETWVPGMVRKVHTG